MVPQLRQRHRWIWLVLALLLPLLFLWSVLVIPTSAQQLERTQQEELPMEVPRSETQNSNNDE